MYHLIYPCLKFRYNVYYNSVEMMVHAKRARAAGSTQKIRLQGLIPSPQEFHKEMILLQVGSLMLIYV